jgi:ATP-binding cassette, subfamily A (ABC1), member 3
MEEASALANKVGILAGRMLGRYMTISRDVTYSASLSIAVGTTDALAARYALYEVHFPARTREEIVKAQELMARIPGSRMADDVATRFEVPIRMEHSSTQQASDDQQFSTSEEGKDQQSSALEATLSLAQLFETLSKQNDFPEYTVERISLESVFLKVIREHNIQEENTSAQRRDRLKKRAWRFC